MINDTSEYLQKVVSESSLQIHATLLMYRVSTKCDIKFNKNNMLKWWK